MNSSRPLFANCSAACNPGLGIPNYTERARRSGVPIFLEMRSNMKQKLTPAMLMIAAAIGTLSSVGHAEDIRPDATLLQFPDVSETHIVFAYANDLWLVPREGGAAQKLASPPGPEMFPRFNPEGDAIAFMGNYEGGRDIYVIPIEGNTPTALATRLTYHPASELLSDWTPDGESVIFSSSGMTGMTRAPQMFKVSAEGGDPEKFPIPYGSAGALSPDGKWLAYTPPHMETVSRRNGLGYLAAESGNPRICPDD